MLYINGSIGDILSDKTIDSSQCGLRQVNEYLHEPILQSTWHNLYVEYYGYY